MRVNVNKFSWDFLLVQQPIETTVGLFVVCVGSDNICDGLFKRNYSPRFAVYSRHTLSLYVMFAATLCSRHLL